MRRQKEIEEFTDEVFEALLSPDLLERVERADLSINVILTTALEIAVRLLAAEHGQPKLREVLHAIANNPDGLHNIHPGWVSRKLGLLR